MTIIPLHIHADVAGQVPFIVVLCGKRNGCFTVAENAFVFDIEVFMCIDGIAMTGLQYVVWIYQVFAPMITMFADNACVVFHEPCLIAAFPHGIYQCSCLIYR